MRETVNLNRKWAFIMGSEDVPKAMPSPACYVNLPHTWNAIDGQDGGNDYYRGLCWYVKTLSREEILSTIWGRNYDGELKIVDVNIRRLRIKIEDDTANPTYLTTVWGFGYKWGA